LREEPGQGQTTGELAFLAVNDKLH
jgi:hypothetical protein